MTRILTALAATLALLVFSPAFAEANEPDGTVVTPAGYDGPPIYGLWPTAGEVATVLVYAPVDRRWGVNRVARQWNEARTVRLILTSAPCRGCITISQGHTLANLAEADVHATGGVIEQCDIRLDRQAFFPRWAIGRRSVVAHELGHCLGLGHSSRSNTAVGTMSGLDGPTWRDLEWIQQLYGAPRA